MRLTYKMSACRGLQCSQLRVAILLLGMSVGCAATSKVSQDPPSSTSSKPMTELRAEAELDSALIYALMSRNPPEDDLDWNGILDSVDVLKGYAHDVNHNGLIDYFERPTPRGSYDLDFDQWSADAREADTLALCREFGHKVGYGILCYVPATGGDARLTVHAVNGELVATISECVRAGFSHHFWALRTQDGFVARPDTEYYLRLRHGGAEIRRLLRWGPDFRF